MQRYEENLIKQTKSMIFRTSLIQFNNNGDYEPDDSSPSQNLNTIINTGKFPPEDLLVRLQAATRMDPVDARSHEDDCNEYEDSLSHLLCRIPVSVSR